MTTEENRALNYNLNLIKRRQACEARKIQLQGNKAAAKTLNDRTQAVKRVENNEQQSKIKYNASADVSGCGKGSQTVNG